MIKKISATKFFSKIWNKMLPKTQSNFSRPFMMMLWKEQMESFRSSTRLSQHFTVGEQKNFRKNLIILEKWKIPKDGNLFFGKNWIFSENW